MSEIYGLDEVLRDLDMTEEEIDKSMDNISKEVATEILDEAINNVNGPNLKKSTKKGQKNIKKYNVIRGLLLVQSGSNYKAMKTAFDQPYPVAVRTGSLKRSLKVKRIGKNKYKVFADMNVANYACWVHDGTSRMRARPFLDDAVQNVMDTKKYLNVATKIIEDILDRR